MLRQQPALSMSIALIAVMLALVAAPIASAHQRVIATTPARNSTVKTSVRAVTVTFSGTHVKSGTIKVTGPRGVVYSVGRGGRDPRKLTRIAVPLKTGLPVGRFTVAWTIVAADGHALRGSWLFNTRS